MRKVALCLVPLVLTVAVVAVAFRPASPPQPSFGSLEECRAWAIAHGYRTDPDGPPFPEGHVYLTLFITDDPAVDLKSATGRNVPKRCAYLRFDAPEVAYQYPGEPKRWGKVFVWGDPEFVAELEAKP